MLSLKPKSEFLSSELPDLIIRFNNVQAQEQPYVARRRGIRLFGKYTAQNHQKEYQSKVPQT